MHKIHCVPPLAFDCISEHPTEVVPKPFGFALVPRTRHSYRDILVFVVRYKEYEDLELSEQRDLLPASENIFFMAKCLLEAFESFGEESVRLLKEKLNVATVDDFLSYPLTEIREKTGIEMNRIQQWKQVLELFKIPQLSPREAELLFYVNINSIEELSHRQAIRIYYKLRDLDKNTYFIIIQFPTLAKIDKWIYYAKLMTKRIKNGLAVPLLKLPLMTVERASELQKLGIWTAGEFLNKIRVIKDLRKRMKMGRKEWREFVDLLRFLEIDGIDAYFATTFFQAGIKSVEMLHSMTDENILTLVKAVQNKEEKCVERLTLNTLSVIKQNIAKRLANTEA